MKYYIFDRTHPKGFYEVTESEYNEHKQFSLNVKNYVDRIQNNEITINDVTETYQAAVEECLRPTIIEKAAAYDILMGKEVTQ